MTLQTRAFACPSKYVQGPGEIENLAKWCADLETTRAFAVITPSFVDKLTPMLTQTFEAEGLMITCEAFGGQTTRTELDRLAALAGEADADVVIGIGGGKAMDAGKYAGIQTGAAIVTVPTIASTDAPTSALSATYTESGEHAGSIYYKRNPDLVLVDSQIILDAPAKYLAYGMGDALSTYFEAKAHVDSDTKNRVRAGYKTPLAAMALSELCYTTLMAEGRQALADVENHELTEAVEDIIEVNTLLSGIGVESAGCAGAHSLNSGFSALPECQHASHGEIVAFGTICELVLENYDQATLESVLSFNQDVGLPLTLSRHRHFAGQHRQPETGRRKGHDHQAHRGCAGRNQPGHPRRRDPQGRPDRDRLESKPPINITWEIIFNHTKRICGGRCAFFR
ncbi:MAG: glycerol dehydrogenase [Pseudoramibacter sp.]